MVKEERLREIYAALGDETSRKIYQARLMYSLLGDMSGMNEVAEDFFQSVVRSTCFFGLYKMLLGLHAPIYIFGCGLYGRRIASWMPDVQWAGFIDSGVSLPSEAMGMPVFSCQSFCYGGEYIVISSRKSYHEMYAQLKEMNVSADKIVDGTVLWDLIDGAQYFDLPFVYHSDPEIFVDAGAFDGLTSVQFAKWAKGTQYQIYCFEPDESNCEKITNTMKRHGIHDYHLIPKGLWDTRAKLDFMSAGDSVSHFQAVRGTVKSGRKLVEAISLDACLPEGNATFIKMDVEGSELRAIMGASDLIRDRKPKLAICIYHNLCDIWELPDYILSLQPNYTLFLRHYSETWRETVLYAV